MSGCVTGRQSAMPQAVGNSRITNKWAAPVSAFYYIIKSFNPSIQALVTVMSHEAVADKLIASSFPKYTTSEIKLFKDGWQKEMFWFPYQCFVDIYLAMSMQLNFVIIFNKIKHQNITVLNSRFPTNLSSLLQCPKITALRFLTSSSLGSCLAIFFSKEMVGFFAVSRMSWTFLSPRSSRPLARMPTLITPFSSRAGFSLLLRKFMVNTQSAVSYNGSAGRGKSFSSTIFMAGLIFTLAIPVIDDCVFINSLHLL